MKVFNVLIEILVLMGVIKHHNFLIWISAYRVILLGRPFLAQVLPSPFILDLWLSCLKTSIVVSEFVQ